MKIAVALLLSVAALFCVASPAAATSSLAATPQQDSVVGTIGVSFGGLSFTVDARSGPSGEAPTGTVTNGFFTGTQSDRFQSTSISCLAVTGNTAVIGALGVRRLLGPGPTGPVVTVITTGLIATITDNGDPTPPPPGEPFPFTPDTVTYSYVTTPNCAAPPADSINIGGHGGLVVVDAQPPLPTSKDQCKNGGWRQFGSMFKNQGQCVAFVERGSKP